MSPDRLTAAAGGDTLRCPLCGFHFAPGGACHAACPMHKGCRLACCPHCGLSFLPDPPPGRSPAARLARALGRIWRRAGARG